MSDRLPASQTDPDARSGHQLEVQLGHVCNNRCVFCDCGSRTAQGRAHPVPEAEVLRALEEAAAQGVTRVTLLGGEPTIQRAFFAALERSVALGFEDIVIFTNGVRGDAERFHARVAAIGEFSWRVSIQGGDEASHDRATGRPGAWRKLTALMTHVQARGGDLTANLCVNEHSYRSLPRLYDVVHTYGVRQLHVDMLRPDVIAERDDAYLRSVLPRHTALQPYLRALLTRFDAEDPGYDAHVGNYPFCLLPDLAHRIHHGGEPTLTVTTGDAGALDRVLVKYEYQRSDAVYAPGCDGCAFRSRCRGVPAGYARLYGTDELVAVAAVPPQRPPAAPRRPAPEVLGLARMVRRLLRRRRFAGWWVTGSRAATDRRAVTLAFADRAGHAVELRLRAAPEGVRAELLAGEHATKALAGPLVEAIEGVLHA